MGFKSHDFFNASAVLYTQGYQACCELYIHYLRPPTVRYGGITYSFTPLPILLEKVMPLQWNNKFYCSWCHLPKGQYGFGRMHNKIYCNSLAISNSKNSMDQLVTAPKPG